MPSQKKKALITGILGQDGSYLAEFLLSKNYEVHGFISSRIDIEKKTWRIAEIQSQIELHVGDVSNTEQVYAAFNKIQPDEVYHLASKVEPRLIFEQEKNIFDVNFLGGYNFLRAIKEIKPLCRLYCAGSSLMFGAVSETPQNENTPLRPTTPYGIAKVACYHFVTMYRQAYGLFACTGILYNHESPKRDEFFLPRKITKAVAAIKAGLQDKLLLGDVEIQRDWSFAGDVVESMWLMLQQPTPEDYVIGTGQLHSVKELLQIAFDFANLDWQNHVEFDKNLIRKVEYANLCADISKAKSKLNWSPKVNFKKLIQTMVEHDLELLRKAP